MTRIIQRCFLILAFTGVLLSSAQETTVSEVSDSTSQTSEKSPSAPESSFNYVGTPSSYSSTDNAEDEKKSSGAEKATTVAAAAAESSSAAESSANGATQSYGKTTDSSSPEKDNSTTAANDSSTRGSSDKVQDSSAAETSSPGVSHTGVLSKAELQDGESSVTGVPLEKSGSSEKNTEQNLSKSEPKKQKNDISGDISETTSETSEAREIKETTTAAHLQSSEEVNPSDASNNSGQSSVPSKEESIYNSSHVDKNQSPGEMYSTTPSKVQTEESESDPKSATRKRSLNATNTMTSSTTVLSSEETSSSALVASPLSYTVLPAAVIEGMDVSDSSKKQVPVTAEELPNTAYAEIEDEDTVSTGHDIIEIETTSFPRTISSAIPDVDVSAAHVVETGYAVPEISSSGYPQDTHASPISSAALSTLNEESIHPSDSIGSTAQALNVRPDISTMSSIPQRSPELEIEDSDSAIHSQPSASSITFDPNGMTHNFSQDPDSVTFSPGIFHVDGMPTDGYLSHFKHGELSNHRPELIPDHLSTAYVTELIGSSSHEMEESYSLEREREMLSSPSHGLLPHDESDNEEMASIQHNAPVTQQPSVNRISTIGSTTTAGTSESSKVVLPLNDESEEMLNDSPHFVQVQSKPTVAPTPEVKIKSVNKDLEMNVSNDITHATSLSSQNTPETLNELDISKDYQTEQSEIRPVTAVSPLKTSESITVLPDSPKVEFHSSSEVTTSGQPDTILPDTSSPIILPNPAPSVVNQSAEATTVVLQPDIVPQSNTSNSGLEQENDTTASANSTIAGVAVKTSVSVSLPLSKTPNDTINSTVDPARDDAKVPSNISGIILPLPIPINKDADGHPPPTVISTEAPTPSTTVSRGLRIRKPKLRINDDNDDEPATPRTRKPFIPSLQRSTTTVGPPVSIFKKARTRMASITSSTTARPFPQFSTIRIHYASRIPGMVPGGELVFSVEPISTTVPTTTETEEPFSDEPFTEQTQGPIVPTEDHVTLIKVAGIITVDKGLRWTDLLNNRHSPQYKEREKFVLKQLNRIFRTSPIASQLWGIEIDGFSTRRNSRSVTIDFFLKLIKSQNEINPEQLITIFNDKLVNNSFSRFTFDTNRTAFEILNEEPMRTTLAPEEEPEEPVIPQWAIAVIVVGAASLIFIVLFAAVAILGRHHVRRRYSNKLNDEDSDRPSDWESKMAAAYENLAADTIYDAEDLPSDTYKKSYLVD